MKHVLLRYMCAYTHVFCIFLFRKHTFPAVCFWRHRIARRVWMIIPQRIRRAYYLISMNERRHAEWKISYERLHVFLLIIFSYHFFNKRKEARKSGKHFLILHDTNIFLIFRGTDNVTRDRYVHARVAFIRLHVRNRFVHPRRSARSKLFKLISVTWKNPESQPLI